MAFLPHPTSPFSFLPSPCYRNWTQRLSRRKKGFAQSIGSGIIISPWERRSVHKHWSLLIPITTRAPFQAAVSLRVRLSSLAPWSWVTGRFPCRRDNIGDQRRPQQSFSPSRVPVQSPTVSKPNSSTEAAALSCGGRTLKGCSQQLCLMGCLCGRVEHATPVGIMETEEISAERNYKEPGSSSTQANSGEAEFKQIELRPEQPGEGLLG